jgi:ABC-2 type transport system ATP-binding protein
LILDEPTSGLDPLLQREFLELVRESARAGATVFMSSHVLTEVEAVADRVAIIRSGVILEVESVATLRARAGRHVTLSFAGPISLEDFSGIDELTEMVVSGRTLTAVLHGSPDRLLKAAARHETVAWSAHDVNLEDLFLDRYREDS